MIRALAAALATGALCLAVLAHAHAQEAPAPQQQLPCTSFAELTKFLGESYHEKPASIGLQNNGQLIEIFTSPNGETWTAITTSPAGLACVVAAGKHWMNAGTEGAPA